MKLNDQAKHVDLRVADLRTRVQLPPPPPLFFNDLYETLLFLIKNRQK